MTKTSVNVFRRWPTPEAEQWVNAFSFGITSDASVLALVAFGSAVRSEDYCADVDLLVIYERLKPTAPSRPVEVDIRWHEKSDAERLIAEGHELLCWVVSFGELICQRNQYWTNLRNRWRGRMPFPSADIAERRAARAEQLHAELEAMGDLDERTNNSWWCLPNVQEWHSFDTMSIQPPGLNCQISCELSEKQTWQIGSMKPSGKEKESDCFLSLLGLNAP